MLLCSIIGQAFSDLVATADLSVVERVDGEYGLDVPALFIVNVSVPEELEKAVDAHSSMRVIDDLAAYQQYQIGAATKVVAVNPAGGIATGGIGVGMGLTMAGRIAAAPQTPAVPQAPPRRPRGTSCRAVKQWVPSLSTTCRARPPRVRCVSTLLCVLQEWRAGRPP